MSLLIFWKGILNMWVLWLGQIDSPGGKKTEQNNDSTRIAAKPAIILINVLKSEYSDCRLKEPRLSDKLWPQNRQIWAHNNLAQYAKFTYCIMYTQLRVYYLDWQCISSIYFFRSLENFPFRQFICGIIKQNSCHFGKQFGNLSNNLAKVKHCWNSLISVSQR